MPIHAKEILPATPRARLRPANTLMNGRMGSLRFSLSFRAEGGGARPNSRVPLRGRMNVKREMKREYAVNRRARVVRRVDDDVGEADMMIAKKMYGSCFARGSQG